MTSPRSSRRTKRSKTAVFASLSFAVLALSASSGVDAKYFSKGWDPSTPTQRTVRAQSQGYNPNAPRAPDIHPPADANGAWKLSDLNVGGGSDAPSSKSKGGAHAVQQAPPRSTRLPSITSVLSNKFTAMTGFNVTAAYEKAEEAERMSRVNDTLEGFVRLGDDNWEELVVEEEFEQGISEDNRVWMMLLHGPPRDIHSVLFSQAITNASLHRLAQSELLPEGEVDMPEVKFAKMDYMTESSLPLSWLVMRPPQLVFITKRGSELRFLSTRHIRPDGDIFYSMVKEEAWKEIPVWESSFGPGGSNAWVVKVYQWAHAGYTRLTDKVPGWVLAILMGLVSQQVIGWLHKPSAKQQAEDAKQAALRVGIRRAAEIKAAAEKKAVDAAKEQESITGSAGGKSVNRKGAKKVVAATSTKDGVEVTVEKKVL